MSTIDTKSCRRIWKTKKTIEKHSWNFFFWNETSIIDKKKLSRNTMLLRKSNNTTISKFISIVLLRCIKIYDCTFSSLRLLIDSLKIWKKRLNETLFKFVNFNRNCHYIKTLLIQSILKNKTFEFKFVNWNTINLMTIEHLSLRFKNNKYQKNFKLLMFRSQSVTIMIK